MASALDLLAYLRVPIAASGAIAASLGGLLYWKQNELIYPRAIPAGARTEVPTPADYPRYDLTRWETLHIPTSDAETLHGFLIKPSNPAQARPLTLLMFHGNAGNIGHRIPIVGVLEQYISVNVVMLEYRGYGKSTGTPEEKGLNLDASAGLKFIREREDLKNTGVVLYGQSLGGAVATALVEREQHKGDIKGLVLENTFLSIRKMIPSVLPAARILTPLCSQIWPTEDIISKIKVPTLFLSGLKDEIVPASHMQRLHSLSTAAVKDMKTFADGTHNDTIAAPGYFDALTDFLEMLCSKSHL